MDHDDAQLVVLIKRGNKKAFEEIYEKYHRPLYSLAFKYLKNREHAEDAVQDIFVGLWFRREKLNPAKSVTGLLFVSMKNHILNMNRNRKIKKIVESGFDEADHANSDNFLETLIYSEQRDIINKGLANLPDKRREVFYKKVFQGYSNPEIAKQLFISVNTVKVHYYHALKFMKSYLRKKSDIHI
jgi:RNA polymerase sigma-70 factor (family 1)